MVDGEGVDEERLGAPESHVGDVGEEVVLPAVPDKMQRPAEEKQQEEETVVEGKDAQGAASVKGFEEVGLVERVEQDAGDEEAGENEEEVDSDVEGVDDGVDDVEDGRSCGGVRQEEMKGEDEKDCETADSIECRDVSVSTWILRVARCGWGGNGSRTHTGLSVTRGFPEIYRYR